MTVAHWARHGENVANTSRTFSCRGFDGGLTDRGIAQAGQLAVVLRAAGHRYGLLVCSPLRRARQTGDIVPAGLVALASSASVSLVASPEMSWWPGPAAPCA